MKFLYEYRTSDNAKHNGVICASDREAAYAELKKQGIKPSRFAEAPGFFNKLFGKGKRWIAIGVLGGLVVAAAFVIRSNHETIRTMEQSQDVFDNPMRRQVIGDPAIIEKGIRTGWADVFDLEGDRFLASYAIPGAVPAIRNTTEAEIEKALARNESPDEQSAPLAAGSLEARQIRAIVEGLKAELRDYLADGGTIAKYGRRIVRRQEEEIGYYTHVKNEVENAAKSKMPAVELEKLCERRNAMLRQLGICPITLPDKKGENR